MNELSIRLSVPAEIAQVCCRSVGLEAQSEALSRSRVELSCADGCLILHVTAKDLGAMRAAVNTYLRWVIMCCDLTGEKQITKKV
jgi:tRNA threonylcarbamoyladenosine modification (KEOPS) complex  Pcc1 subunit